MPGAPLPPAAKKKAKAAIVASIRNGAYRKHAAQAAGVDPSTLKAWEREDDAFAGEMERAYADAIIGAIKVIEAAAHTDWKAAAWWLERAHPKEFGDHRTVELHGELTLDQVLFDNVTQSIIGEAEEVETPEIEAPK